MTGLLALCLPSWFAQASTEEMAGQVGEVTLVLGKAWIDKPGAGRTLVRKGTLLHVADSIETTSGGRVHIRFIDNALVSVRPASILEIQRYEYRPEAPAESVVKFNLVEGVTRAISGEAAHEARQNFRMNTPVAAIGVRGTDFVVSADRRTVRALVNEGAIVVAPYSSQCLAEALGPCSLNGLELASELGQIVQVSANNGDPVLLPLSPNGLPESMLGVSLANREEVREPEGEANSELYAESVTARAVNPRIVNRSAQPIVTTPEFTPELPLPTSQLSNSQLVWGRWTEGDLSLERITAPYSVATLNNREGTVGNNRYALFRAENGSKLVQPGLGVVAFSLTQAQANYRSESGLSLMDVNGGSLSLDFDLNRYATSLRLHHSQTGAIELIDNGRIYGGGYFHNRTPGQVTAGAVTLDGREAGYFFEKTLENGNSIDGLTLWSRQP